MVHIQGRGCKKQFMQLDITLHFPDEVHHPQNLWVFGKVVMLANQPATERALSNLTSFLSERKQNTRLHLECFHVVFFKVVDYISKIVPGYYLYFRLCHSFVGCIINTAILQKSVKTTPSYIRNFAGIIEQILYSRKLAKRQNVIGINWAKKEDWEEKEP